MYIVFELSYLLITFRSSQAESNTFLTKVCELVRIILSTSVFEMKTPAKLRPVKVIVTLAAVCLTLLFCYNTLSSTLHSITRFKKSTEFNNLRQDPHTGILHEQKSMLSSKQRMRLRSIRDGEVTKKDI